MREYYTGVRCYLSAELMREYYTGACCYLWAGLMREYYTGVLPLMGRIDERVSYWSAATYGQD